MGQGVLGKRKVSVSKYDSLDYVMDKLKSERTKTPDFLVPMTYDNALKAYRDMFGELDVKTNKDYDKACWILLLNECVRCKMPIDMYVRQHGKALEGIPF